MDLNSNVNAALLANKAKRDATTVTPVVETPPAAVETKNIQTPVIPSTVEPPQNKEAVPPSSAQVKPNEEKPKPVEAVPVVETTQEEEFKWDASIPDLTQSQPETTSASIDFKKLGSALNLDIKSEEEFISKVTETFSKVKELETQSFDGLPEQLKQAAEIARKGGDWLAYTGVTAVDASKLDAVELFERDYERQNQHRFKNPDGSIDYAKMDEAIDAIDIGMKELHGNQIKNAIVQRQQQQQAAILSQTAAQQDKFQKGLGEAAKELSSLLPREQFGISIEPRHGSYLYEGINNGTLIKKHLGNIDPAILMKFDTKKLMKTLAIAEFGEGISTTRYKQGEVAGKKALLTSTQNVQLQTPSYSPRPNDNTEDKPASTELLKNMLERQKPKNSL